MAELKKCDCASRTGAANATGGAVYGFGLFGALFFYLSTANTFGTVVMGILKAFVWPAMMVYNLFKFLGM